MISKVLPSASYSAVGITVNEISEILPVRLEPTVSASDADNVTYTKQPGKLKQSTDGGIHSS